MMVGIEAYMIHTCTFTYLNIGTQSVQELFFCDRSISRTVYSNDLFKSFSAEYTILLPFLVQSALLGWFGG